MVVSGSLNRWDRYHIITQLAIYTTYIPLIYCQLGDYMVPTTYLIGNQETPLMRAFAVLSTFPSPGKMDGMGRMMGRGGPRSP